MGYHLCKFGPGMVPLACFDEGPNPGAMKVDPATQDLYSLAYDAKTGLVTVVEFRFKGLMP